MSGCDLVLKHVVIGSQVLDFDGFVALVLETDSVVQNKFCLKQASPTEAWNQHGGASQEDSTPRELFEQLDQNKTKTVTLIDIRSTTKHSGACGKLFKYLGFNGSISISQMRKLFQQAAGGKSAEELNFEQFEAFLELCKPLCAKISQELAAEARAKEAEEARKAAAAQHSGEDDLSGADELEHEQQDQPLRDLFDEIDQDKSKVNAPAKLTMT